MYICWNYISLLFLVRESCFAFLRLRLREFWPLGVGADVELKLAVAFDALIGLLFALA